jgi:O-antigen/teichoic acid export membrane protein
VIVRRVAVGGATNFAGKAIGLGTWFVLTPFILDRLGAVEYGIWVLIGSLGSYGFLLDLGVAGAVVKYVAEFRARGDWSAAQAVVATAMRFYLVLAFVAITLGAVAALVLPMWLTIPSSDEAMTAVAIFLTGIGIGLSLAFMPASSVLRGLQRYDLYNLITTIGALLTAAGTVIVLIAGGGLVGIVAVSLPVTVLMQLVSILVIRRIAPQLQLGWGIRRAGPWRGQVARITRFGSASLAMNASATLQTRTDEIIIAAFLPVALVTPYALARRLTEIAPLIPDQFVKVLLPLASELEAVRDTVRLQAVTVVATRLTLAIILPATLILITLGGPILAAWVGPAYAASADLVAILAVAALFRGFSWPAATLAQGMARHHPIALLSIASGLTNVGLSIVLVQAMGVVGVAYGTLIPTAIEAMIVLPYGMRVVGMAIGAGLRDTVLPPLLPAVPTLVVLLVMRGWLQPTGIDALVPAAIGLVVYGGIYGLLGATRPEREMVRAIALASVRRLQGANAR